MRDCLYVCLNKLASPGALTLPVPMLDITSHLTFVYWHSCWHDLFAICGLCDGDSLTCCRLN